MERSLPLKYHWVLQLIEDWGVFDLAVVNQFRRFMSITVLGMV